jgi:23S rRNA (uracil1939-C5)-methyltransferase
LITFQNVPPDVSASKKKMKEIIDIRVDRQVYGGNGMGKLPDGRAVFIPFTIAGELVRIRLVEERKSYARAELVEVLEPSPVRVIPRCKHFTECGGCHYQHINYPAQVEIKSAILCEQLERIGGLQAITEVDVI